MPLYRVSYLSRAPETRGNIREQFVAGILSQARANNNERGITGMLVYADDYFIQVIEGSRGVVSALLGRIMADERHQSVNIVHANPVSSRIFPQKMACFDVMSKSTPLLQRYVVSDGFDPYQLSPQSLDELVEGLVRVSKKGLPIPGSDGMSHSSAA
ncbi:MAG: BLUF domain-containing protein [Pseudomonadota bacterium]